MTLKIRVVVYCVVFSFIVLSLLSSLATVKSVRNRVEHAGVNSRITTQPRPDATSEELSGDSGSVIFTTQQSTTSFLAKIWQRRSSSPNSSSSPSSSSSITWVFFVLLAVQAGCQPVLVKAFTPTTVVRSTAVLAQEIVKFLASASCLIWSRRWTMSTQDWSLDSAILAAGLPAGIYVIQNYCNLMANQTLPPITFGVLNQTKTLSAAFCCFVLLGTPQSGLQIVALMLLIAAALIIQSILPIHIYLPRMSRNMVKSAELPPKTQTNRKEQRYALIGSSAHSRSSSGSLDSKMSHSDSEEDSLVESCNYNSKMSQSDSEEDSLGGKCNSYMADECHRTKSDRIEASPNDGRDGANLDEQLSRGVLPALLASILSGLAGTLVQKTLQLHARSPHLFNMELACFSSFFLLASLAFGSPDGRKLRQGGVSQGWTWKTWIPIVTNAAGGILVGFVTKYSGVVMKGFALIFGLFISGVLQHLTAPKSGVSGVTPEQIVGGCLGAISLWMHARFPPEGMH